MKLPDKIREEQKVWATPSSVAFYQTHRHKPEELKPKAGVYSGQGVMLMSPRLWRELH